MDLKKLADNISAINAVLPAAGTLVKTAAVLAPNAAGLTKAGMVIDTLIALEPALAELESVLAVVITGLVKVYRSDGSIPPAATPPVAAAAA